MKNENIGLTKVDPTSQQFFEKIQRLLFGYGYKDIEKLGNGAFGLVLQVKTAEGFVRAVKAQVMQGTEEDDVEFKFAKIIDEMGAETLFGNSLKVYSAFVVKDDITGIKISIIELQLADNSLSG